MDALAVENLAEIEEQDISQRAAKFDNVQGIDEAQRRQFSLQSGTGPRLEPGQVAAARSAGAEAAPARPRPGAGRLSGDRAEPSVGGAAQPVGGERKADPRPPSGPSAPEIDDLDAGPTTGRAPLLYLLLAAVVLAGVGFAAWYLLFRSA